MATHGKSPKLGAPVWMMHVNACHSGPWPTPRDGLVGAVLGVRCMYLECGCPGAAPPEAYDQASLSYLVSTACMVGVGVGAIPFNLSVYVHAGQRLFQGHGNALFVRATKDTALAWREYLVREAPDAEWPGSGRTQ